MVIGIHNFVFNTLIPYSVCIFDIFKRYSNTYLLTSYGKEGKDYVYNLSFKRNSDA